MVISLLKIVGKYTKLFLGSQIIGCVFMKKHLLPQNPLQRRMYLIRISDYLYVAHYHGNKGFVIIRFCTNRVLCRMMVVDYDYLCSIF
mgnify:FL=1